MECDSHANLSSLLQELINLESLIVDSVGNSKRRDDTRGAMIIDDYRETHPPAEQDSMVQQAQLSLSDLSELTERLIRDSPLATFTLSEALASLSQAQTLLSLSSSASTR